MIGEHLTHTGGQRPYNRPLQVREVNVNKLKLLRSNIYFVLTWKISPVGAYSLLKASTLYLIKVPMLWQRYLIIDPLKKIVQSLVTALLVQQTDAHSTVWAHQSRCLIASNLVIPSRWWSFSFLSQICRSQFTKSIKDPSRCAAQQALTPSIWYYQATRGHTQHLCTETHKPLPIRGRIYWPVPDTKRRRQLWILQGIWILLTLDFTRVSPKSGEWELNWAKTKTSLLSSHPRS